MALLFPLRNDTWVGDPSGSSSHLPCKAEEFFSPHGQVTGSRAFDYKQIFGSCQIHKIRNCSVKSPMTDRRGKTYPQAFPLPTNNPFNYYFTR